MTDQILTRSTAPAVLVTLADAKLHCRVDHTDDDAFITGLVSAVEAVLDGPSGMVGKALATQSWTLTRGAMFGADQLAIPVLPFISVTSIKYYDDTNTQITLDAGEYVAFGGEDFGYINPVTAWPAMYNRLDTFELIVSCGFSTVPANLIVAAKMLVSHWYENREATSETDLKDVPFAVEHMVNLNRIGWVAA